jgi:hypothetical protein
MVRVVVADVDERVACRVVRERREFDRGIEPAIQAGPIVSDRGETFEAGEIARLKIVPRSSGDCRPAERGTLHHRFVNAVNPLRKPRLPEDQVRDDLRDGVAGARDPSFCISRRQTLERARWSNVDEGINEKFSSVHGRDATTAAADPTATRASRACVTMLVRPVRRSTDL